MVSNSGRRGYCLFEFFRVSRRRTRGLPAGPRVDSSIIQPVWACPDVPDHIQREGAGEPRGGGAFQGQDSSAVGSMANLMERGHHRGCWPYSSGVI